MQTFVDCNGIRVACRLEGPDGAPVVMFGNSLMCNYDMWTAQAEALSSRYRVLRYDLRGQGRTETPPGPYAIDQFANDALGLLEAFAIDRVHYVGLSFGGLIGQKLAIEHPEVIESLTLCDTGSRFPPREIWDERIAIASSEGMTGVAGKTLKRWFPNGPAKGASLTIDDVQRMILDTPVDGFLNCCRLLRDPDLTEQLHRIEARTLVVFGSEDPMAPLSQYLHRGLAGADCIVIEGAGHLANVDDPEAFAAALAQQLGSS